MLFGFRRFLTFLTLTSSGLLFVGSITLVQSFVPISLGPSFTLTNPLMGLPSASLSFFTTLFSIANFLFTLIAFGGLTYGSYYFYTKVSDKEQSKAS